MTTRPGDQNQTAAELETQWKTDARWNGVERDYTAEDVIALRGSVQEEHAPASPRIRRHWPRTRPLPHSVVPRWGPRRRCGIGSRRSRASAFRVRSRS